MSKNSCQFLYIDWLYKIDKTSILGHVIFSRYLFTYPGKNINDIPWSLCMLQTIMEFILSRIKSVFYYDNHPWIWYKY